MPATNPNAGQFAKQSAYSSGYGSTNYDALSQTAPDYNKTAYQSGGQPAKGHSATNQTAANSDIASSMYNKSHVTLNKVNVSILLTTLIDFIFTVLYFSHTTNNRSTRVHRHHSTWPVRRLARKRKLINSICTFSRWHRIITWTCISPSIRWASIFKRVILSLFFVSPWAILVFIPDFISYHLLSISGNEKSRRDDASLRKAN